MAGKFKGKNLWGNTVGLKAIRTTEEKYNELSEAEKARTDVVYVYKKVIKSFLTMANKIGYKNGKSVEEELDDINVKMISSLGSLGNKINDLEYKKSSDELWMYYSDGDQTKSTKLVTDTAYKDTAFRHRGFYPNGQSMLTQKQGTYQLTPNNQPSQGRPDNFSEYAALMVMNDGYPIILYIDVFGSFAIWNSNQVKWVTH